MNYSKIKKIGIWTIAMTSIIFMTQSATADIQNISNYTPIRPGATYQQGALGMSYPSFNNFTNNPNINIPPFNNDERYFTIGKYCENGTCPTGECTPSTPENCYFNTIADKLAVNDKVRFQVYFHNNGEDSYDGGTSGSPDAQSFKVGIEFNDIQDSSYNDRLHPRGFVSADNNLYKNTNGTTVVDSNNNPVRKATDDLQLITNELGLMLKPVSNSGWLYLPSISLDTAITSNRNITFTTATPQQTVSVTPHVESDKMYLQFNRYPGCFRYSGYAYFDATVVKNYCDNYTTNIQDTGTTKANKKLYKIYKTSLSFHETGTTIPAATRYKWTTSDPSGCFYTSTSSNTCSPHSLITETSEAYYTGSGTVSAHLTRLRYDTSGNEMNPIPDYLRATGACQTSFTFPATCQSFSINTSPSENVSTTINNQTVTVHKININGPVFSPGSSTTYNLKWTTTDSQGKFYTFSNNVYYLVGNSANIPSQAIYYVGAGTVSAHPVLTNGSEDPNLNTPSCNGSVTIPSELPICIALQGAPLTSQYVDVGTATLYMNTLKISPNSPTFSITSSFSSFPIGLKWTRTGTGNFYKLNGTAYANAGAQLITATGDTVYYSGPGTDTVTTTLIKTNSNHDTEVTPTSNESNQLNQAVCKAPFDIPVPPDCKQISVVQDPLGTILEQSWTTFKANSSDINNQDFRHKFTYSVSPGKGFFYTSNPPDQNNPGQGSETLNSINSNQDVFFHAISPATNAISINTNGTSVGSCGIKKDIAPAPPVPVCRSVTLSSNPVAPVVGEPVTLTIPNSLDSLGNPLPPATKVHYSSTAGGKFYLGTTEITNTTVVKLSDTVTLKNSTQVGQINFEIDPSSTYASDSCKPSVPVTPAPKSCILFTTAAKNMADSTLETGALHQSTIYEINAKADYSTPPVISPKNSFSSQKGILTPALPSLYLYLTTIQGETYAQSGFATTPQPEKIIPNGESAYFLPFADQTGDESLTTQAVGYENDCRKRFNLAPLQTTCNTINVSVFDENDATFTGLLVQNKIYKIQSSANYTNPPATPQTTYSSAKGLLAPGKTVLQSLRTAGVTTYAKAQTEGLMPQAPVIISENTPIYFLPFENSEGSDALIINTKNFETTLPCNTALGMAPIVNKQTCGSISVNLSPASFSPTHTTTIKIDPTNSKFHDFQGSFEYSATSGRFYKDSDTPSLTQNPRTFTMTDATSGTGIKYDNGSNDENVTLSIKAVGDLAGTTCNYSNSYSVETPGCTHNCGGGSTDKPTIVKAVYDVRDKDWKKDVMAIGWKDDPRFKYVIYRAIITINDAKEISVKEDDPLSGLSASNKPFGGKFDLRAVAVVTSKNETILKTANFSEFTQSNSIIVDQINKNQNITFRPGGRSIFPVAPVPPAQAGLTAEWNNSDTVEVSGITSSISKIYVLYLYENKSTISSSVCENLTQGDGCGAIFPNTASMSSNISSKKDSNDVKVTVMCPVNLVRESGDVFFHDTITTGNKASLRCMNLDDSTGLVVRPRKEQDQTTPSNGPGETTTSATFDNPNNNICNLSNDPNNSAPDEYKNVVENFSSSICEMQADVAKIWKEKYINEAIKTNITKLARWAHYVNNFSLPRDNNLLTNSNGVIVIDGDLTIDNGSSSFMINGGSSTLPAAQTYIVRNGTLKINSDIYYDDSNPKVKIANPKTIPSAAFIVIDGNIEISNDVKHIDGVLMAVDTGGTKDGQINSAENSPTYTNTLTIRGSLIGNIKNLFDNRQAVGDPLKDESSITVRYDERILLNTPPGLGDLIDIAQLRVAR